LLPVSRGWLSGKKYLAARLGEEFSLDSPFHRTFPNRAIETMKSEKQRWQKRQKL
jgi:hypothetical protein